MPFDNQTEKWKRFGLRLKEVREAEAHTTQGQVGRELDLSTSTVAMIEQGNRPPLSRGHIVRFVQLHRIWPPLSDDLLRLAGHDADRTPEEELHIQRNFAFTDLFVFARHILEPTGVWYDVVLHNLRERRIRYCYLTSDPGQFFELRQRLQEDAGLDSHFIDTMLECIALPEQLFVSNFALYKHEGGVYCCGTKRDDSGRAIAFYTKAPEDAKRLHEQLLQWIGAVHEGRPIHLGKATRVHPKKSESVFVS